MWLKLRTELKSPVDVVAEALELLLDVVRGLALSPAGGRARPDLPGQLEDVVEGVSHGDPLSPIAPGIAA